MSSTRTIIHLSFAAALLGVPAAWAQPTVDQPAALLDFPYVVVDTAAGLDTVVQITNATTTSQARLLCVLQNANGHCSNAPGTICSAASQCPAGGACVPGWSVTDFLIELTPGQPIGFRASQGLSSLPCDGGVGCPATASGSIPPPPEDPFVGRLQCVTVNGSNEPTSEDLVRGRATVERVQAAPARLDAASYGAIGLRGLGLPNDGDLSLQIGSEYTPCANVSVVSHFFEHAPDPVTGDSRIHTRLAIGPCSQDPFVTMTPGTSTLEYVVFNEFEQRLTVRHTFTGLQTARLSQIEPLAWDVGIQGTLSGQTRIRSVSNNPVVVTAIEEHDDVSDPTHVTTAALDVATQGEDVFGAVLGGGASGTCGNGSVEPGEQCDDGNVAGDDGCDANCLVEDCYKAMVLAAICNSGSGSLDLKDNATDKRDGLKWRFDGPMSSMAFEGLENPVAATDYTLCVFDGSALKLHASVTHGGTCGSKPCWKTTKTGFGYRNSATNADGLKVAKLKRGADDFLAEGTILLKGKGANLPLPGPASATTYFTGPVRAVLVKKAGDECWQTELGAPTKNTTTAYSASTP